MPEQCVSRGCGCHVAGAAAIGYAWQEPEGSGMDPLAGADAMYSCLIWQGVHFLHCKKMSGCDL